MTRVGWCPGGRPVADMLALYAGTGVVRIFVGPGKPLPAWDGPILGPVPPHVVVHVSFKTNPVAEVLAWAAGKPAGRLLLLTADHEPEQQDGGDPSVAQFHAGWAEPVAAFDGHPMRDEILLGPVYTRYWWQAHPGDLRWLVQVPVDFIGWDIYNNGTSYRSPDDLLSIPRAIAARTGLPYLIAELGAVRIPGDLDGSGRTAWMRATVAAAKADGALTVCWFHKDEWDLTRADSVAEQQTWQDITRQEAPVTRAPANLLAVRRLLLDHLNIDPNTVRSDDLEPAEVGIVGDPDHRGGYHCGSDRVVSGDYSVVESSRDRTGLTLDAAALDVGLFKVTTAKGTFDLHHFSRWCVQQCIADAPDSRDLREIIYSPDGKVVRRWDRLGRRTSGDDSHLWHTHFSFFRDSIKAGRDQTPLFRRYLTTIGLIPLEDDMPLTDADIEAIATRTMRAVLSAPLGKSTTTVAQVLQGLNATVARESTSPTELATALASLPQPQPIDTTELATALAGQLLPGLVAALPDSATVSQGDLEAALRTVLGSVDAAPAQG